MSGKPAEWTLNPVVERQIDLARQSERAKGRWGLALAIVSLVMGPLACFGSFLCIEISASTWLPGLLCIAPFLVFGIVLSRYGRTKKEVERHQALVHQEFSEVEGWLVEMSVVQGEAMSGRDMGTVWFEDGRLYFTGARTSFGIGLNDTQGKALPGDTLLESGAHYVLPLRATTAAGPLSVAFAFLARDAVGAYPNDERFRRTLREWFSHGERTIGQLPPTDLGIGLPSELFLYARAALTTAALPTVLVLLACAIHWKGDARFVAALVLTVPFACLAMVYPPRRCRQAVRDRRRLELAMRQDKNP